MKHKIVPKVKSALTTFGGCFSFLEGGGGVENVVGLCANTPAYVISSSIFNVTTHLTASDDLS